MKETNERKEFKGVKKKIIPIGIAIAVMLVAIIGYVALVILALQALT